VAGSKTTKGRGNAKEQVALHDAEGTLSERREKPRLKVKKKAQKKNRKGRELDSVTDRTKKKSVTSKGSGSENKRSIQRENDLNRAELPRHDQWTDAFLQPRVGRKENGGQM